MLMKKSRLMLALLIAANASSSTTYTTSKGVTFTEVEKVGFGAAWKDPSGMIWSSDQGQFSNQGTSQNKTVVHSPATAACTSIGGGLPAYSDFVRFFGYFHTDADVANGYVWSDPEVKDLLTIVPDAATHIFWTSTIADQGDSSADVISLNLSNGEYVTASGMLVLSAPMSVLCVAYSTFAQ